MFASGRSYASEGFAGCTSLRAQIISVHQVPVGASGKEWLMRRVCVLTAVILLACSMAQAEVYNYHFFLDGPQADATRVPQSPGTGEGHVTYNSDTNQLSWNITYQNLLGA